MKRIAILGSTGSVGTNTLRVVADWPDRFRVTALAAGRNVDRLIEQIRTHKPELVSVAEPAAAARIRAEFPEPGLRIEVGSDGLAAVATESGADMVVSSMVGAIGLEPTLAAVEAGLDVGLANKETLVMAGEVMTAAARKSGATFLPIDSEHAALHQILDGRPREHVERLVLTASGGPFRTTSAEELRSVTLAQALEHPTWTMGSKITIDSATLANKGLEVIEARWLFDVPVDRIDVVVHPQSIVHSLVEWIDGTFLAQLGVADMRAPIQYALTHPDRLCMSLERLDLAALGRLDFEPPDTDRFPSLRLAFEAAAAGGTHPAVFNAANEVANAAFRDRRLDFLGIPAVIEDSLERVDAGTGASLEAVQTADRQTRERAELAIRERAS